MLHLEPPPSDYDIARSDDPGKQLTQLAYHLLTSTDPPIAEIERVLKKHLTIEALPVNKPSPTAQDKRTVKLGLLACLVIVGCQYHLKQNTKLENCFLTAWPAIWRSLQFLNDQCLQKYGRGETFLHSTSITIATTIEAMSRSKVMQYRMASTPGVVAMMTIYWTAEGSIARDAGLPSTAALSILLHPENRPSTCLPEFIATVPGGAKSAAVHAIRQLNAVIRQSPPHELLTTMRHITLIGNLSSPTAPNLLLELLCQGMIPATIKTLVWLGNQSTNTQDDEKTACQSVNTCFAVLINAITCSNGPSWVVQALDAGILSAALKSAPRVARLEKPQSLQCSLLLSNYLCQYLVYKPVIRAAAKALRKTERLNLNSNLGGPIWEAWVVFEALARDRIALKESLGEKDDMARRCNRVDCRTVIDPDNLLRCAGCISAKYCDKTCQKKDWSVHKSECENTQQSLLDGTAIRQSHRESRFISEIVQKDIWENEELMKALLTAHLDKETPRRSSSEFGFQFDYTQVPLRIRLIPISDLRGGDGGLDTAAEECLHSERKLVAVKILMQRGSTTGELVYTFLIEGGTLVHPV